MKKVLILAYDFPPYVSVGGLRPLSWYKYLHEFGIYPIVVTRQWGNKYGNQLDYIASSEKDVAIKEEDRKGTIIKAPYKPNLANRLMLKYGEQKFKLFRKLLTGYYELAQFLSITGPKSSLFRAADEYLKNNQVDAIIATGEPFVLFQYAKKLSRKYNLPWMADYRDPWSQNLSAKENFLWKHWNAYFEIKTVSTAKVITTVDNYFKHLISGYLGNREVKVLTNGFDPETIEKIAGIKQKNETLQIAYVGYIYKWHPIKSFLAVISKFINQEENIRLCVNFYGINMPEELNNLILREFENLTNHVKIFPKIPNELLIKKLAEENLLLLFNYYSFSGTKIYDYLGLKRSILFCYTDDEEANLLKKQFYPYSNSGTIPENLQESIIHKTKSGYLLKDASHLLKKLEELYKEFLSNGYITCNTIDADKYSRKYQVKKMAEIIKNDLLN
ncbi:MAG: hypothetical protein HY062_16630 [Bacteroidetes bacterium]|nr:hypothetical protein [Bacteroidota bacterium]